MASLRVRRTILFGFIFLCVASCSLPNVDMFSSAPGPLKEITLQGKGKSKIAVITVAGEISDQSEQGLIGAPDPSMLQEVIARVRLAAKDPMVKALVLKVDSPGGSITASDILYNELMQVRDQSDAVIVVSMMNVAASGGYYISLPADYIMAHPTTITGSVGVIFIRPQVQGLMGKVGLDVTIYKSGSEKDMGSPFRPSTAVETELFETMIDNFARRFLTLVQKHRKIGSDVLDQVKTARIYTAQDALAGGLIDAVGYLDDAFSQARRMAGLPEDTRIVAYRRTEYPNDTVYNTLETAVTDAGGLSLVNVGVLNALPPLHRSGFYYLWWPFE